MLGERISGSLIVSHGGLRNHGTTSCLNYSMTESGIKVDGTWLNVSFEHFHHSGIPCSKTGCKLLMVSVPTGKMNIKC